MSKRAIILIIDSFGIGEMEDTKETRIQDVGANTVLHIAQNVDVKWKNLEKLGLGHLVESKNITKSKDYYVGSSNLKHQGADSFFGHQEIFGTDPLPPIRAPFNEYIDKIVKVLSENNIKTERYKTNNGDILIVEDSFTIADNVETDPGQAFNITADLNMLSFDKVLEIAKIVRKNIDVSRLIVFGSKDTSLKKILSAVKDNGNGYVGIDAPKSGVYTDSYECVHLGYGVNTDEQIIKQLYKHNITAKFIGKVGDIVENNTGINIAQVDTETLMKETISSVIENEYMLIATNIQETDLAGHSEDVNKYANKVNIVDEYLGELLKVLKKDDLLIVCADHGNDPTILHSQHTREMVPILIYPNEGKQIKFETRETLADIGSTVVKYLTGEHTINGNSIF